MTEQIHTDWATERPRSSMRSLWRLMIWGTLAGVSVFVAIISAYSGTGHRASAAVASSQPVGPQAGDQEAAQQRAALAELRAQSMSNTEETRRLSEAVRTLAADRDQLASRIAGLERGYDTVTGSVKRPSGSPPAAQANPSAINAAPAARPEAPMMTGSTTGAVSANSAASGSAAPMPAASAPQVTMAPAQPGMPSGRGEEAKSTAKGAADASAEAAHSAEPLAPSGLGVDVGGAPNFEGLRSLWHSTKNNDPSLLDDFYPLVATRENSKTHAPELRLIIGPMPDAEAAAQLCVTLAAAHQYCQPVAFEGQRLAIADFGKGMAGSPRHRAQATQPVSGPKVVPAYPTGK